MLRDNALEQRRVDLGPADGADAVRAVLPELHAADLGRRGVLHHVIDGDAADAAQEGLHVLYGNGD